MYKIRVMDIQFFGDIKKKDNKTVDNPIKSCYNKKATDVEVLQPFKPCVKIDKNEAMGMMNLIFCNMFRDDESSCKWAYNSFKKEVEQADILWVRQTRQLVGAASNGQKVYEENMEVLGEKPIVSCDFNQFLVFYSNDVHKLEYIKFEIEKRMRTVSNLEKIFKENTENQ